MEKRTDTFTVDKFESSADLSFKNNANYKRQISFNSTPEVYNQIHETAFNRQSSVHDNTVVVDYKDNTLKRQFSNQSEKSVIVYDVEKQSQDNGRRNNTQTRCILGISIFSCIMSLAAILLVVFRLLGAKTGGNKEYADPYTLGHSHTGPSYSSLVDSGTFKLDDTYLRDYKKLRWQADENSSIVPQGDYGCLLVKTGGKYLVVSRFTLCVPADVSKPRIFHSFTLLNNTGEVKNDGFSRMFVNAKEGQKTPSVFIKMFELAPGEQICVNVTRPDLVYLSKIDNDVNLIKM